jgi:hypothetical protein
VNCQMKNWTHDVHIGSCVKGIVKFTLVYICTWSERFFADFFYLFVFVCTYSAFVLGRHFFHLLTIRPVDILQRNSM